MITRTGKDRRTIDPATGKRVGRDTRSYTAVAEIGVDENGQRIRKYKSFPTEAAAKEWLAATTVSVNRHEYVEPTAATMREFLTEWLESVRPGLKPTTASSYAAMINGHLIPGLGRLRVKDVTEAHVGKLYSDMLNRKPNPLSPRTVRYAGIILRTALKSAIRRGLLTRNAAEFAELPRQEATREMRTWTGAQVARLLQEAEQTEPGLAAAFRLAASTGARRGEICGLKWGDVDLTAGTLTIRRARVLTTDGKVIETTPKTRSGSRTISLDPATVDALQAHKVRQMQTHYPAEIIGAEQDIFTRWDGGRLSPDTLSGVFEKLVKAIPGQPKIGIHGLRHSWASLALQAGINPKIVSERLGHHDVSVTLRTYTAVIPAMESAAAEQVAAMFQPEVAPVEQASA